MDKPEGLTPAEPPDVVKELARNAGGTITDCFRLPDGSGGALMSMPLPKDHWCFKDDGTYEAPPMPLRMGTQDTILISVGNPARRFFEFSRAEFCDLIRAAGRYAYRSATMNGKEPDLDPDALLQNLVVGFVGYFTADGRSDDEWANPETERGKRG